MDKAIAVSAGLLVYRIVDRTIEFLLVHPSGAYNKKEPFYIPKGGLKEGESDADAAIRETKEETGVTAKLQKDLGWIKYKTKSKAVHAYLAQYVSGDVDEEGNALGGDWENDVVRFFPASEARKVIREEMRSFIDDAVVSMKGTIR